MTAADHIDDAVMEPVSRRQGASKLHWNKDLHRIEVDHAPAVDSKAISAFLSSVATKKPQDCNAEQVYNWALQLDPYNFEAIGRLGQIELGRGNNAKAAEYFDRCLKIRPDPVLYVNVASAHHRMGNLKWAELDCYKALELKPDCRWAFILLATLHEERGDIGAAAACLSEGIELNPADAELKFHRGLMNLKRGNWVAGWADHEFRPSRLELIEKIDGQAKEWTGEDLTGKTLLVCGDQGIGDQLMFARYLSCISEDATVVVFTKPEIARLIHSVGFEVVTSDRELESLDVDYWVALGSLPHVLEISGPLSLYQPLLEPSDTNFESLIPDDGNLRVGLVWAGNPAHRRDKERSLKFDQLKPFLDIPGCAFYALQHGEPSLQNDESQAKNIAAYCHDMADTAAAIRCLDLIITVDTAVAHLAGSIGKPVWMLTYEPCDWRWGSEGILTPWYPSMRVFRQKSKGDWSSLLADVARTLNNAVVSPWKYEWTPSLACAPVGDSLKPEALVQIEARKCRYGRMYWLNNCHYIGRSLSEYEEYSQSEADLLRAVLKPGDTVIEAGANIGGLTVALADIVGKDGQVIAFEPQPAYYALLNKNAGERATCVPHALGAELKWISMRKVELDKIHAPGWDSTGPEFEVKQVAVDDEQFSRVDLLKVDCDGPEMAILEGAEQTIDRCRPLIYVEHDKEHLYPEMLPWLKSKGYRLWQHNAPLFNPDNFAGNSVNIFGSIVSLMVLAVPVERKLDPDIIRKFELQPIVGSGH